MKKRHNEILGFFGTICFLSGAAFFLVKRQLSLYVLLNILAGISLIIVYLFFNIKEISKTLLKTKHKGSRNILFTTGATFAAVLLINLFSSIFYTGADFTKEKVSSISDHSQKVVKWLKDPIEILVFTAGKVKDYEQYLLESYNFYNKNITYRFMDPEKNPQLAQEYKIDRDGQGAVKHKDGFVKIFSVTEQNVTNAIIKLTQKIQNTVYFISGHDEHNLEDLKSNQGYGLLWHELKNENYYSYHIKLEAPNYYIPGNCTILAVCGPRRQFTDMEMKAVKEYLYNNGRAIFLLDPNTETGLEKMLEEWGIQVNRDCFLDLIRPSPVESAIAKFQGRKLFPMPVLQILVKDYPEHEITNSMKDKSVIFNVARTLERYEFDKIQHDLQVEILAETAEKGWAETNLDGVFKEGTASRQPEEKTGHLPVGALSVKGTEMANSKIIVFGDSDFVNNEFIHQLFNRDLFMNCMAFLSKQSEFISVRPRHLFASRLDYNPRIMTVIFTISVLILPQLFLMAGIMIWWLRR